jgi:hypothetical protein
MKPWTFIPAFALAAAWAGPASALCIYHGVDNAETSIAQEFKDARWVVRAHLVSADDHWQDQGDSWSRYRLKVVETFKGSLPRDFTFFTARDSGGFYMEFGTSADQKGDYLLFLVPWQFRRSDPAAARGALWVNYNCGRSTSWDKVSRTDIQTLRSLARR